MKLTDTIQQWTWQLQARLEPAQALTWLFRRFSVQLHSYALTLGGRREVAEDAVQEVFLSLSADLKKLVGISHPQVYLYRAVRNQVLRHQDSWSELPDDECLAADSLGLAERAALLEALQSLPLEQREALFLKEVLRLSFKEIAEILGISLNTVASRHRYALARLRELLSPNTASKENVYV